MWLFMAVACIILQMTATEGSLGGRHLNPEGFMTISEIIRYWGYPCEEYQVLTADGYYLQVNRIPYGVLSPGKTGPRPIALIVHGVLADARIWISNIPSNSLGFFLADVGYDVWLLNCRGTTWSRRHQSLSIEQDQFWDFSFHEMGIYDVPATIHFILEKTQQDGLYYIGHSQGSTIGLIAFSVMPQLGQKVKLFICLAPIYTLVDFKRSIQGIKFVPEAVVRLVFGNREFCLLSNKLKGILAKLCSYAVIDWICIQTLDVYRKEDVNVSRADVYAGTYPDFTSVKTMIHWKQVLKTNEFKYFDYGWKNKAVYNLSTPPFYNIEDMITPTAVWSGEKDTTSTIRDGQRLLLKIKHLIFYNIVPYWAHDEFHLGVDAPELLYPDMFFLMQEYK